MNTFNVPTKWQQLATPPLTGIKGRYLARVRRRRAFEMRLRGCTIRQMARELRTGLHQIVGDLKALDAELERRIDAGQETRVLNERLSNLEAMRDICLECIEESDGNERVGYLNTLAKLEQMILKLLQDAGVLRKATSTTN